MKMKKISRINSKEYRKFKILEISYLFYKTLVIYIIFDKCKSKHKIIFKDEEPIEILKILSLIRNI